MPFTDTFCVYKDDYAKFEGLVEQYGVTISNIHLDGWTNGRYLYVSVETVDDITWFQFCKDVEATLDRGKRHV